jgi:colanic acid biosynthesis glycosyl transferase WcaI
MTRATTRFDTLFISQYYWPEPIGSGPYCRDLAESLAGAGRRVAVFACRPHYPAGAVHPDYRGGARDTEIHNGIEVRRAWTWVSQRRGAAQRILSELAFFAQGLLALVTGKLRRSELVVCLCPSIFAVLVGRAARRRDGLAVALVHDIQSGLAQGLGIVGSGRMLALMRALERTAFNRMDRIFVLSDQMRVRLRELGVARPISVLPIWVDTNEIYPLDTDGGHPVTLLYSGNLGRKQALGQIVDLARALQDRHCPIRIVVRGEGSEAEALLRDVAQRGIANIEFQPLVAPSALNRGLADGDIHLVPQDPRAADFAVPSKIYSIMAAGRPFVATARPGSAIEALRDESRAFVCVPPGDVAALTDAVLHLAEDPGRRSSLGARGRAFIVERHARPLVLDAFLSQIRDGC